MRALARPTAWPVLATLFLAGCLEARPGGGDRAVESVTFPGGLVVAGPDGYCIDGDATRRSDGFALLASCRALSDLDDLPWVEPAILTVTESEAAAGTPSAEVLAEALAPADLLSRRVVDGLAIAHVARGGEAALPGGDPKHWRAVLRLGDRLLGLAVYAPEGSSAAGTGGERLIRALAARIRAATVAAAEKRAVSATAGTE